MPRMTIQTAVIISNRAESVTLEDLLDNLCSCGVW